MYILHDNYFIIQRYSTERGAKTGFTRKWKAKYPNAVIMEEHFFNASEPMVETTNILSGKKLMIRKSEKGGCCDPGTERYHSM